MFYSAAWSQDVQVLSLNICHKTKITPFVIVILLSRQANLNLTSSGLWLNVSFISHAHSQSRDEGWCSFTSGKHRRVFFSLLVLCFGCIQSKSIVTFRHFRPRLFSRPVPSVRPSLRPLTQTLCPIVLKTCIWLIFCTMVFPQGLARLLKCILFCYHVSYHISGIFIPLWKHYCCHVHVCWLYMGFFQLYIRDGHYQTYHQY